MSIVLARANTNLHSRTKRVLLSEQMASTLLLNILYILRYHYGVMFACVVMPILPFIIFMDVLWDASFSVKALPLLGYCIAIIVCPAALTVALSDICLGNEPKLKRAFAHILGQRRWWYLTTTALLLLLAVLPGAVLLMLSFSIVISELARLALLLVVVVVTLWIMIRGFFISTIVVLEGRRNLDAIRRSFVLTKGQSWRLSGLYLLPNLLIFLISFLIGFLLVFLGTWAGDVNGVMVTHMSRIATDLVGVGFSMPVLSATVVLLYYDQRSRRESYDAQALFEDLMR